MLNLDLDQKKLKFDYKFDYDKLIACNLILI
jgi:hypothetical protein